jgi:hypothetical protein
MSSAQATSSLAADAPRYGVAAADAYYALNQAGTGATTVTQIVAGSNVTISPPTGTGTVTINAATQAPGVTALNGETGNVQIQSTDGSVIITTPGTGVVNLQVPNATSQHIRATGLPPLTGLPSQGNPGVVIVAAPNLVGGQVYSFDARVTITSNVSINPSITSPGCIFFIQMDNAYDPYFVTNPPAPTLPQTLQFLSLPMAPVAAALYPSTGTAPQGSIYYLTLSGTFVCQTSGTCNLKLYYTDQSNVSWTSAFTTGAFQLNSGFGSSLTVTPVIAV